MQKRIKLEDASLYERLYYVMSKQSGKTSLFNKSCWNTED